MSSRKARRDVTATVWLGLVAAKLLVLFFVVDLSKEDRPSSLVIVRKARGRLYMIQQEQ